MSGRTPIVILGGGVAGLAVGMYARRAGLAAHIIEAGPDVGGNARTLSHGPFRFDTGAHRLHDRYPAVTADVHALLGDQLTEVSAPSQIWWQGRFVDFPLTPINALRQLGLATSARAARDLLAAHWHGDPADTSFEALAVARYGRTLADLFLLSYSRKLWGVPCGTLAPGVAGARLQGLSIRMLWQELRRHARRRAAHLEGRFWYPRDGIGALASRLADACGPDAIRTGARVTRLAHRHGRVINVELNGTESIDTGDACVVTTLPPALTVRLLDPPAPADVLDAARGLRFRHVVLATVMLDVPSITRNATIYFPGSDFTFTRASEPRNRSVTMAPIGRTSLSLEIPCWQDDAVWKDDDRAVIDRCVGQLAQTGLIETRRVSDGCVHRLTNAYPVLDLDVEPTLERISGYLGTLTNLESSGRVGGFAYVHLHDLMRDGRALVDRLALGDAAGADVSAGVVPVGSDRPRRPRRYRRAANMNI